jgi:hypothetical protein
LINLGSIAIFTIKSSAHVYMDVFSCLQVLSVMFRNYHCTYLALILLIFFPKYFILFNLIRNFFLNFIYILLPCYSYFVTWFFFLSKIHQSQIILQTKRNPSPLFAT